MALDTWLHHLLPLSYKWDCLLHLDKIVITRYWKEYNVNLVIKSTKYPQNPILRCTDILNKLTLPLWLNDCSQMQKNIKLICLSLTSLIKELYAHNLRIRLFNHLVNPIWGAKRPPYQFLACNFYKSRK